MSNIKISLGTKVEHKREEMFHEKVNSLGKHEEFLAMILLKRSRQREERNIEIYKVLFCISEVSEEQLNYIIEPLNVF